MRIETESTGRSRYTRAGGWWIVGAMVVLPLVCFMVALAHQRIDDQRDRISALERQIVADRQTALAAPLAYDLTRTEIDYLRDDVEACHGRWDATYSQMEDFWGVFIGGKIPPGRRYPLPDRPPAPPERLPADYCGLVALVPAAQALGACRPRQAPPTMPALPDGRRAASRGAGIVGGAR